MKDRRQYQSAMRAAQKAQTRQSILDSLALAITRAEFDSVSMEQIAAAAGVAPATLYRYFPNREALLDGLVEQFDHVMGDLPYPQTLNDLTVLAERSFTAFDQNPALVRAFLISQLGRTARKRGRPRRIQAIRAALQPITRDRSEAQRRAAEAVIAHLSSIQTWQTMTEEFGMTGAEVGQAVAWAIDTLIRDLQTERESYEWMNRMKGTRMEHSTGELTQLRPGEGSSVWFGPIRVTFKVTGADTEGRYALFETLDPPQSAPPMHIHHREEESYYIVEGEYEIHLADVPPIRATAGAFVTIPRGTVHTYKSVGTAAGRMIVVASPAGLERFFAAAGQADTGAGAPPLPAGPPDFTLMAAIAQQYGIEIVGPPPF